MFSNISKVKNSWISSERTNSPDSPSLHTMSKHEGLINVISENISSQAISGVIGTPENIIQVPELQDLLHRSKNLGQTESCKLYPATIQNIWWGSLP